MPHTQPDMSLLISQLPDHFRKWGLSPTPELPSHTEVRGNLIGKRCKTTLNLVDHDTPADIQYDARLKSFNAPHSCREAFKQSVTQGKTVLFLFHENKALLMEATTETKQIVKAREDAIKESIYPWDRAMSRTP